MTNETHTILLVEDDPSVRTFLTENLAADGYAVIGADDVASGRRRLETEYPDIVILDVTLPDGNGYELLRTVREADGLASRVDPTTPVMMLSGLTSQLDRVRGFERGADDYLGKPFHYPELLGRVGALVRRRGAASTSGRIRVGDLEVDAAAREVRLAGHRIHLSQKEFALLRTLATDPTRVFSKDELLRSVWGFRSPGRTRTVDAHACRLRGKLSDEHHRFVVNVWGVGYRLIDGPVAR